MHNKIGISLIDPKHARRGLEPDISYETPLFTADDVFSKLVILLENKEYKLNSYRMQSLCRATGGRSLAADTIERVAKTGGEHLLMMDYHKKSQKVSCAKMWLIILSLIGVLGIAIVFFQKF